MRLGIMSDTHGNRRLMHQVAGVMLNELGVQTILHLGDDYADAEELAFAGHDVRIVPGLWCREYLDSRIPNRTVETFDGVSVACVHADKDLTARERAADIVLFGHTHVAKAEVVGRSLYLNPGHLKAARDRGQAASFAVIEIVPDKITVAIHESSGIVRSQLELPRSALAAGAPQHAPQG